MAIYITQIHTNFGGCTARSGAGSSMLLSALFYGFICFIFGIKTGIWGFLFLKKKKKKQFESAFFLTRQLPTYGFLV